MPDAYEAIFTALAHPARRRILISLNFAGGEMSAGAIAGLFAHAWPTTTRHLQALEAAGLFRHERRGRARIYRLDQGPARARPRLARLVRAATPSPQRSSRDDQRRRPACSG